jgi:hypothetical protein
LRISKWMKLNLLSKRLSHWIMRCVYYNF